MPHPHDFRRMSNADVPAAIDLWRTCEGVGTSDSDHPEELAKFLVRNPGMSWVAVTDAGIVGAVLAGHDGRRGFLYHLAVHADMRRLGIGRGLVTRALEALKAAGILKCQIVVFRMNEDARRFWLHLGWVLRDDLQAFSMPLNQGD